MVADQRVRVADAIGSASPEDVAGLLGSVVAMVVGATLAVEDYRDFEKIVCDGCSFSPYPHPHHGFLGLLLFAGGLAGTAIYSLRILRSVGERGGANLKG